jgi:uncharacterized protein DUF4157/zincin-like metallopeptidase toxin 3 of polymorphic toxin system
MSRARASRPYLSGGEARADEPWHPSPGRPVTAKLGRAADPERVARVGVEGGGDPLPQRARLETAFNTDLSRIRVHTGAPARDACETLGAAAYTLGRDIALAVGPSPWVLAHEVAHTIQQGVASPRSGERGAPGDPEAQADRAATAALAGRPAHATRGGAGPQFLRIDDKQIGKFPRSETYVREEMPKTVNDARLMKAVNEAGRNIGSAARDYTKDLSWGSGPTVRFEKRRPGKLGGFEPGTSVLKISTEITDKLEAETDAGKRLEHEFQLETSILHEYVHYLADGKEKKSEEFGQEFETKAYGQSSIDPTFVLSTTFMTGQYEVTVEGKEAAFEQRFRIVGADEGDGTYAGKVGTKVTVKKGVKAPLKWQLVVEHLAPGTSEWKASRTRRSLEIDTEGFGDVTNQVIRSEDLTDRDFNDLEIRVRRTSAMVKKPSP